MCKAILSIISAALIALTAPAYAITLSITPATQTVDIGDSLSVAVRVAGLDAGTAPSLGGYDIDVGFDSARLNFTSAQFGDPNPLLGDQLDLAGFGLNNPTASATSGNVNLIEADLLDSSADLDNLQAGDFILATLFFDALSADYTAITLSVNSLADALGNPLTATTQFGSVTINAPSAVPLPSTAHLLIRQKIEYVKNGNVKNVWSM